MGCQKSRGCGIIQASRLDRFRYAFSLFVFNCEEKTHLVPIIGSTPNVGAMDGRAFVPVKPMLKNDDSFELVLLGAIGNS